MARFATPSRLASEVYPNLSASSRKHPASPVSISEAAERVAATQQRRISKRTSTSWSRPPALSDAVANKSQTPRRPRTSRKAMPATPNTCENFPEIRRATRQQRVLNQQVLQKQQQETPLTLSPQIGPGKSVLSNDLNTEMEPFGLGDPAANDLKDDSSVTADMASISAATPPAMDLDPDDNLPGGNAGLEQAGPPPLSLSPIVALDGSLPSPSLSPVTAALNHGNQADYFATPEDNDDIESSFELPPPHDPETSSDDTRRTCPPSPSVRRGKRFASQQPPTPTLMEIPLIIDSFDSMPSEMQTYLMYQFLRRCSKKTLQF